MVRTFAGLFAAVALSGCLYHLRVESNPKGAVMTVGDEGTYVLPTDLHLKWTPFRAPKVRVEALGYRPLEFRMTRGHMNGFDFLTDVVASPDEAFGDLPRRVLEVRLVPEHGPSGTWSDAGISP